MKRALLALALAAGCATAGERLHARGVAMSSGMTVVDEARVLPAPPDAAVREAVAWWAARYPEHEHDIRAFIARGTIVVVSQPACPMPSDPWYPPVRPVWAETVDNVTRVCWSPATAARFIAAVQHEIGHMALSAAWRAFAAPRDDHAVMKSIGYPWAHRRDGGGPAEVSAWRFASRP